jgi:hypothetical protein
LQVGLNKKTIHLYRGQSFHTLVRISSTVDGAISIFSEDDISWYRESLTKAVRGNVLLEFGLFAGVLGVKKAIICLEGNPNKPSDLSGINIIDVSKDRKNTAKIEIREWLESLKKINKEEQDVPTELSDQKDRTGKKNLAKCEKEYLLSEKEEDVLRVFIEYGQLDDFSLTLSEIKSILNPSNLLRDLEACLTKLKIRGFLERECGRKRAYFITEKGWQWISNTNFFS